MNKLKTSIVIAIFIVLILFIVNIEINKTIMKSDKVWGHERNQDSYKILNMKQEGIPSTLGQINEMSDNSNMNIDYVVIYQENKWFKEQRKLLKIMRLEREFPDFDFEITDTMYYRLVDEIIEDIDENYSVFIRLYEKYEHHHNLWSLEPISIIIPKVETIIEGKQIIKEMNSDFLRLLPITIVENEMLNRWKNENYDPSNEFTDESPEGLSIEDVINTKH
ncbi:hypothetical protein [Paenibacillus sp. IITD108]|uniref:hypothetical protein n=1 Tax=Paenibacillus sp. IITD108 TaxID=3116649 RepID=UPI002F40D6BC